jgi:hypothetical protein
LPITWNFSHQDGLKKSILANIQNAYKEEERSFVKIGQIWKNILHNQLKMLLNFLFLIKKKMMNAGMTPIQ